MGVQYLVLACAGLGVVAGSWGLVSHYADTRSSTVLSNLVVMATSLSALMSILIIPVDIYATVNEIHESEIGALYLAIYSSLAACACVWAPFAYFYAEQTDNDDRVSCCSKTASACGQTAFSLFILALLLGASLLVGERRTSHVSARDAARIWADALSDESRRSARAQQALLYATAGFAAVGFLNLVLYAGYGIASLPIALVRGRLGAEEEQLQIEFDQLKLRKERERLSRQRTRHGWFGGGSRGAGKGRVRRGEKTSRAPGITSEARSRIHEIDQKLRVADRRVRVLEEKSRDCGSWCWSLLAPFRVSIGAGLLGTSIVLVATCGLFCIDRYFNSDCGFGCGYMLDGEAMFPNPLDALMVALSHYFPLDYAVFAALGIYLFASAAHGIKRVGVRLMGVQIYKVRRGRTPPQGLLAVALLLAAMSLSISVVLLGTAPQYVSFGQQTYTGEDGKRVSCELSATQGEEAGCRLTRFARFIGSQVLGNRIFSLVFFFGQAGFVCVSVLSLFFALCRRKEGWFDEGLLSDSDESVEELQALNKSRRRAAGWAVSIDSYDEDVAGAYSDEDDPFSDEDESYSD